MWRFLLLLLAVADAWAFDCEHAKPEIRNSPYCTSRADQIEQKPFGGNFTVVPHPPVVRPVVVPSQGRPAVGVMGNRGSENANCTQIRQQADAAGWRIRHGHPFSGDFDKFVTLGSSIGSGNCR